MNRLTVSAIIMMGFMTSANAADADLFTKGTGPLADLGPFIPVKDPLPEHVSFYGITVIGALDLGYTYETHGLPNSPNNSSGLSYEVYGNKFLNKSISTLSNNASTQSYVGLRLDEAIYRDFRVIGQIDTGFEPLYGAITNNCQDYVNNAHAIAQKQYNSIVAYGDGSRCGQMINGQAYGGVASTTYGQLIAGRLNSPDLDTLLRYDPTSGAFAFSGPGASSAYTVGMGATATSRWDQSVRYQNEFGPFHVMAQYAEGGQDSAIHRNAYGADAGVTWKGFSFDAVYEKQNGAIVLALPSDYVDAKTVSGTASDNESFAVMGKYTYSFGDSVNAGIPTKAVGAASPSSKITAYAGFQQSNINNPQSAVALGSTTVGGYFLGNATAVNGAGNLLATINNNAYGSTRTLQTEWVGLKYETPSGWWFAASYWRFHQDSYISNSITINGATQAASYSTVGKCTNTSAGNCSGDSNTASLIADYSFNSHLDWYGGVTFSNVTNGLASGFLSINDVTVASGMRLKLN